MNEQIIPRPDNEPALTYAPGSSEREELVAALEAAVCELCDFALQRP